MPKFHITENGPAACTATIRECPYGASGGEHFESLPQAEESFAQSLGGAAPAVLKKKKKYAPERLDAQPVTSEMIEEIMKLKNIPKNIGKPLMFGLIGSNLYGLDTPDSDQDIWVLADGKGTGYSKIAAGSHDIRIDTALNFVESLSECVPESIDILRSRQNTMIDDKFSAVLNNFRFNEHLYVRKMEEHAQADFKNCTNPKITEARRKKHLKVAVRSVILMNKVTRDGQYYDPKFNDEEREFFYKIHTEIEEQRSNGTNNNTLVQMTYDKVRLLFS